MVYPQASVYLRSKLEKVCETFNTSHLNPLRIEMPDRREEIFTALRESEQLAEGLLATLRLTEENFQDYLHEIQKIPGDLSGVTRLKVQGLFLRFQLANFQTMNKLRSEDSQRYLIGLLWVPAKHSQGLM